MARRKNTRRIDPRYFLHETTYRDLNEIGANVSEAEDGIQAIQQQISKRYGEDVGNDIGYKPNYLFQGSALAVRKRPNKWMVYYSVNNEFQSVTSGGGSSANLTQTKMTLDQLPYSERDRVLQGTVKPSQIDAELESAKKHSKPEDIVYANWGNELGSGGKYAGTGVYPENASVGLEEGFTTSGPDRYEDEY